MLCTLHIENIAVIEKADVELSRGMNVLTGETGAGKSIVIDALGAVLGGRTSKELVRTGADSALVTAVFDCGGEEWCAENGIETDGELLLSRKLTADGRSTCRVNGVPVPVSMLRELGKQLLDIHGQNDGQRLLDEKYHLDYLDSYGHTEAERSEYLSRYAALRETEKEMRSLEMDEGEKERRLDTLRYQIAELERADIKPGETDALTARRSLLKNSAKLTGEIDTAYTALYGSDRDGGVLSMLREALGAVETASRWSEELGALASKLSDISFAAEDAAEELRDIRDRLDFSPNELDDIESRLDTLRRLSRKYGAGEEEMLEYLESCRTELESMEFAGDRLILLEKEREKRFAAAKKAAAELGAKRRKAAKELEARIKTELSELSMKGVRFEVRLEDTELTEHGGDAAVFLMSANAGEEPGRISKIASGGELARIMLAMKNVLSELDDIGTMVFDEVDTGVSGIAAQRVGEKMARLSGKKQIICVTHLPQIAVMADTHFVIEKNVSAGRTFTEVTKLDSDGRSRELARLIGGDNITDITIASAREQLAAAEKYKTGNT